MAPKKIYTTTYDKVKCLPRDCITCDGPDCLQRKPTHRCTRCLCHYYCSKKCQKNDWSSHKQYCVPVQEMREKHNNNNNNKLNNNNESIGIDNNNNSFSTNDQKIVATATNTECSICLEKPMKNPITLKECNHAFCLSCILQWQQYQKLKPDLVMDYTIPWIDMYEIEQRNMNCPYCREETDENIEEQLMEKAKFLATQAYSYKIKPIEKKTYLIFMEALACLDQVLDTDHPIITAYVKKAEILIELNEAQAVLDTIQLLFKTDNKRRSHPVMKLVGKQNKALAKKDKPVYARLQGEIIAAIEEHGMPGTRLQNDSMYDSWMLKCQAHETLFQWELSLESYAKAGTYMSSSDHHQFYFAFGYCLYEARKYIDAINVLNLAININRRFPGVHKYKILAYWNLDKFLEAMITSNKAALYESPWDEENQEECMQLYVDVCDQGMKKLGK